MRACVFVCMHLCCRVWAGAARGPCIITLLYSCEWNSELIWLEAGWREGGGERPGMWISFPWKRRKQERRKEEDVEGGWGRAWTYKQSMCRSRGRQSKVKEDDEGGKKNSANMEQSKEKAISSRCGTFDWVSRSCSADVFPICNNGIVQSFYEHFEHLSLLPVSNVKYRLWTSVRE